LASVIQIRYLLDTVVRLTSAGLRHYRTRGVGWGGAAL